MEMGERCSLRRPGRVDVLVAVALCLLLILLVPVLMAKLREQSIRRVCAANLSQIGKTMFLYANDYKGALPRAGGPTTTWGPIPNWMANNFYSACAISADGSGGRATISSGFYLLVKYYQAPTRLFLCRGDKGTTEFKLSNLAAALPTNFTLNDAWDFGPVSESYKHCSFSYHIPYGQFPLTTSRDPNLAVAADRNPFLKSPGAEASLVVNFKPDLDVFRGTPEQACAGNAVVHKRDGQNVLFLDGRVTFEKRAYCGVKTASWGKDKDNVYLVSMDFRGGSAIGTVPATSSQAMNESDSVLVHAPPSWGPIISK